MLHEGSPLGLLEISEQYNNVKARLTIITIITIKN